MLGITGKSIMAISTSPWKFIWSFIVWTRSKLPLHNQGNIYGHQNKTCQQNNWTHQRSNPV